MKIEALYSHLNGWEYIQVHKPTLYEEIKNIISEINPEELKKCGHCCVA